MEKKLVEGKTEFFTDSEEKISKEMPVFYNPVMKLNRDLTLALLLTMPQSTRIGLPMEASGLRAARILHELVMPGHLQPDILAINDLSAHAIDFAKRNVAHNIGKFDDARVNVTVNDASQFLRASPGFDYIDIDPFGTPNPFLDSAIQRISRKGILAVTATDTSALAGTYPAATARKYWSIPSRTWIMHEVGMRILIRKVQLVAAQYEKALLPVLSVATDHYYRIFFEVLPSNSSVKDVLAEHTYLFVCTECMATVPGAWNKPMSCHHCGATVNACGPLWGGRLHDGERVRAMREQLHKFDEQTAAQLDKLLAVIEDECRIHAIGFVDMHELASRMKTASPRTEDVLGRLGLHACRTHINGAAVKTDLPMPAFLEKLQLKQAPR